MPLWDETPVTSEPHRVPAHHPSLESGPAPVPHFGRRVRGEMFTKPTSQSHGGDHHGLSKRFGYDGPKEPHATGRKSNYGRTLASDGFSSAMAAAPAQAAPPAASPLRNKAEVSGKVTDRVTASAVMACEAAPSAPPGTTSHANHYQNRRSENDDTVTRPSSRRAAPQSAESTSIDAYGFSKIHRVPQHRTTLVPAERCSEHPSSRKKTWTQPKSQLFGPAPEEE